MAPSDARSPAPEEPAPLPPASRAGLALLLAAVVAAPWPYGSVADAWRYPLAALVFFAAALVALGTDLRAGLAAVLPLAALPLLQLLVAPSAPARTLDAALALYAPLAAWLALRALGAGQRGSLLAAVVAGCALLQAAFGLVQASLAPRSIYGHSTDWMTSAFGSFINHNHFAGYVGLGALLSLGLCGDRIRRDRELGGRALLWAGAASLIVLADLASRSRGGLLGLAAGLVAFVLLRSPRLSLRRGAVALGGVAAVLALAIVLLPAAARERLTAAATDGSAAYRLRLSGAALRLAAAHPLTGAGLGTFEDAVTAFKRSDGDVRSTHAENDVLEYLAESGLLGLGLLALSVFGLAAGAGRDPRASPLAAGATAAAVGLAVHSLCDFNLRVPATALSLAVVLAVVSPARAGATPPRHGSRTAVVGVLAALGVVASLASLAALETSRAARLVDPVARVSMLTRALAWNPLATSARRERARALVAGATGSLRGARLARAAEDYRTALDQRSGWAEAWYELAWVELARGEPGAARRALERAGTLDPQSVPLAAARAALLARLQAGHGADSGADPGAASDPASR